MSSPGDMGAIVLTARSADRVLQLTQGNNFRGGRTACGDSIESKAGSQKNVAQCYCGDNVGGHPSFAVKPAPSGTTPSA
jgi:hypothetical protein